ncbi:hypothetical protein PR048_024213 [Dryococelus australis]|uniref:Uncharacterized protein n=1 Tax=Dryococelus australis TaxID=614101 RepID=A0ABQ9GN12_9NEOP|nr:hypothetical protein PR048_024213 [Dryococelus australis]
MIDVKSSPNYNTGFSVINHPSVFICPPPHPDAYTSQDLYNPVYEELSNGCRSQRGDSEPDSEGVVGQGAASEDEFAEDELSLGGGDRVRRRPQCPPDVRRPTHSTNSSLQGSTGNDLCRDVDSSDADDRSRFLSSPPPPAPPDDRGFSLPPGCRSRAPRPQPPPQQVRRPSRSLEHQQRRGWRGKVPASDRPQDCGEFHEGLLLDALLQLYPNVVTLGGGGRSPRAPSVAHRLPYLLPPGAPPPSQQHNHLVNPYESVPVLGHLHHHGGGGGGYLHRQAPPPDMFTTFRPGKAPSQQDSDSGYSNNTSGGRTASSRSRKDRHRLSAHSGDIALS